MRHKTVWRPAIILILAISLCLISPLPAVSQSLVDYFQLSFEPVSFSKDEIHGSEEFSATIAGRVTCTKDLPVSAGEASLTSSVVAKHGGSGTEVTLNPGYTVNVKPLPAKAGDTAEINQIVTLKFPAQAESGDYNITGRLTEAKVKVGFGWLDITAFLPKEQLMGSLKYVAPESTSTPAKTPPTPEPTSPPASPEQGITWWVWLIIAVAVATTVVNIIFFLRRRIQ